MSDNFFDFQSYINQFKDNPFIISEKLSYTYHDFGHAVNKAVYQDDHYYKHSKRIDDPKARNSRKDCAGQDQDRCRKKKRL